MSCHVMVMDDPSDLPNGTRAADQNVVYVLVRCSLETNAELTLREYNEARWNIEGRQILGVFTRLETALAALAQTAEYQGGSVGGCDSFRGSGFQMNRIRFPELTTESTQ